MDVDETLVSVKPGAHPPEAGAGYEHCPCWQYGVAAVAHRADAIWLELHGDGLDVVVAGVVRAALLVLVIAAGAVGVVGGAVCGGLVVVAVPGPATCVEPQAATLSATATARHASALVALRISSTTYPPRTVRATAAQLALGMTLRLPRLPDGMLPLRPSYCRWWRRSPNTHANRFVVY